MVQYSSASRVSDGQFEMIVALPRESCRTRAVACSSAIAATAERCSTVVPTRNSAASSRLYTVHSLDFLRADRAAEEAGLEVIGVFHSHTHTDPYPSPTDVAQAPDPGWHYAIVSLRHQAPSIRSYRIEQGEVREEPELSTTPESGYSVALRQASSGIQTCGVRNSAVRMHFTF